MSSRKRQRGKDLERFVASDLGGRRVGILGQEDVLWRGIAVECKERDEKGFPKSIRDWMAQAEENAKGATAIVILHKLGSNHDEDIVMSRYKDFKSFMEGHK